MTIETSTPQREMPPPALTPCEPPLIEDDERSNDEEVRADLEKELKEHHPHNFDEYCDYSRRLAKFRGIRPAYIGYAFMPENPLGVCH
jgi:hypothetical protein